MLLYNIHDHAPVPPHATKFENGKWITNEKQEYQQYLCRTPGCNKNCRNCTCMVRHWMCVASYEKHIADVEKQLTF